ncbi:Hypothetical predicted protein [Olea europaea subsp. europaea]|uniref:Uncharacterized protein n=1 Tax=Olea europaea subsp. europaea TaxID=158383 RepID=A0A8S0QJD3_OLEEU|nr:Hypothetical predicted protein [Olea europaea subsp. europaea]
MGSEDDLFSTYINVEKLGAEGGSKINDSVFNNVRNGSGGSNGGMSGGDGEEKSGNGIARSRHKHDNSEDSSSIVFSEIASGGSVDGVIPIG